MGSHPDRHFYTLPHGTRPDGIAAPTIAGSHEGDGLSMRSTLTERAVVSPRAAGWLHANFIL